MKRQCFKWISKLIICVLPITIITPVVSCSYFVPETKWLNNPNKPNSANNNPNALNYASYFQLKNEYKTQWQNIQTNYQNVFQVQNPKWNNLNTNFSVQLSYEWKQWISYNKANNAKYLATLYPQLWSLNNALISLDWYYINYLIVQFVSNLSNIQAKALSFLPKLTPNKSYLFALAKINWLDPKVLVFKHDLKTFLLTQKITTTFWNAQVKSFYGTWICLPINQWTLSTTYNNTQILTLGCVAFNWHMMNQDVPICFSGNDKTNLKINNWNYFNNAQTNPQLCQSNLEKVVTGYQTVQAIYESCLKHLLFSVL